MRIGGRGYLLSLFAWGQIGHTIVIDFNRYGPYFRYWRDPFDPQTPAQLAQRAAFTAAAAAWEALDPSQKLWWISRASTRHMTGKNLYMRSVL
jgi:hypothetical protein